MSKILEGNYGFNTANNERQNTLALDSFMTIWLLTLPKKFKKWIPPVDTEQHGWLDPNDPPCFPWYKDNAKTCLQKPVYATSWTFLPDNWNLMSCFQHYHDQKEFWNTNSIDYEI